MSGAGFFRLGNLKRLSNRFWNDLGLGNRSIPLREGFEHRHDVDVLMRFLVTSIQ